MMPYSAASISQTISELWVNPSGQVYVQWSSGTAPLAQGSTFPGLPASLKVANSYVIFSQVSYLYTPVVGDALPKAGITLSDFSYTRPRVLLASCTIRRCRFRRRRRPVRPSDATLLAE